MMLILLVVAVLMFLIVIALKMGLDRKEATDDDDVGARTPVIHVSGIYSIVRESPREELAALRPSEEDIRKYLANVNVDVNGIPVGAADRETLLDKWKSLMEFNLQQIENGDKNGAVFYYYDHPELCPACIGFITKGNFVTREEIFKYPRIIPPFHLGCNFVMNAHHGANNLKETTTAGMAPFFDGDTPPSLPEWTCVVSPSATAEEIT